MIDRQSLTDRITSVILSGQSDDTIRIALNNYHEMDIALALSQVDMGTKKRIFKILGPERAAEVVAYMEDAADFLNDLSPEDAAALLGSMDADDAVDVLEDLDSEKVRERLLTLMDGEASEDIRLITSFDDDEVGSMMTTNFVTVPAAGTIKEAMRSLIRQAQDNDNIGTIYVTDAQGKYAGAIDLKDLIVAREHQSLDEITSTSYPSVHATDKIDDSIGRLKEYAEDSIPVLNADDQIIGVITATDIVEAVDDAMGDDYAKLAGLTEEEDDLNEGLFSSLKKRFPWLVLLLGLGMVVSSVVGIFEAIVAQMAVVVSFQSLILDMAGNVGTQSLAVTIRILSDRNVSGKEKMRFVLKEMRVGGTNGILLGVLSFVFVGLYLHFFKGIAYSIGFKVAGCVGLALFLAMVISSLVGTVIPMFFQKIKVDPAVASGPLITTVNDLVAVVTYYGLAGMLLAGLHLA